MPRPGALLPGRGVINIQPYIMIMTDSGSCNTPAPDRIAVRRALAVLVDPAHNVELRALPSKRSCVLPGTDLDGLADAAVAMNSTDNVYFTLNPVGVPVGTKQASDADVIRRRWLFFDVDPVRAPDTAATDAEKRAALEVGGEALEWLERRGWPEPVTLDSGNGYYLLCRVDLPNDDESKSLIVSLTAALAMKFSTAAVKIDTSVTNASRIARVAGLVNRKGDGKGDRPWRVAELLDAPDPAGVVTREQLEEALDALPPPEVEEFTPRRYAPPPDDGSLRPGDDYNRRGDLETALVGAGWRLDSSRGEKQCWTRPGKRGGTSATFGYCKSQHGGYPLFFVFSSSTQFEANRAYSPFATFAMLRCAGDWREATRQLGQLGYGDQRQPRARKRLYACSVGIRQEGGAE